MSIVADRPLSAYEAALADKVEAWRIAHRACVSHLRACVDCGPEMCLDGQLLWDAADAAEQLLPWRIAA